MARLARSRSIARHSRAAVCWKPLESATFWTLFLTAVAFDLHAVWSVGWLPMGDVGGWIELMDVMARYDDPNTVYSELFRLPTRPEPNSLLVYFGGLLGQSTIIPVNNGQNLNRFVRHGGLIPAPIQSLTN